jgi:NADPH-dependent 2,4-dienoyl-CoA reductase/sulfur reductase-like enzyme
MRKIQTVSRRAVLKFGAVASAAAVFPAPSIAQSAPKVVVIGGGFGGANCARALNALNPSCSVTLVVDGETYTAFPLSNAVLADLRPLTAQQFGYEKIAEAGVEIAAGRVTGLDPRAKTVRLGDGHSLPYDRLVIAPGIDVKFDAIKGYSEAAAEVMPHAWTNGAQVTLLARQLDAMPDGGVVVISAPVAPLRCPLGPYERASMIAYFLKSRKPKAKLIVLDSKDSFIMQRQFEAAWAELYPGLIEWVSLSQGGNVIEVDVASKTLITDFESYKADVSNVIPPQRAAQITSTAGVADRTGWCPVDPITFESQLVPNIHVIGDAAIAGAMPKAASAASAEGKICAKAITELLQGKAPQASELGSSCYSLIAPDVALAIAGTYRPAGGQFMEVEGTGASTPVDAAPAQRAQEARSANAWFAATTNETFG